jgi:hypothetical protein
MINGPVMTTEDPLLALHILKQALRELMRPEVLEKFVELRTHLEEDGMLDRYAYFLTQSELKDDCRYTKMAAHYFIEEHGDNVATLIRWLYENWASKV